MRVFSHDRTEALHPVTSSEEPLRYIERTLSASTVEEVWQLLIAKLGSYGFDRLIYGFTRNLTRTGLGGTEDLMILSNHAPDYTKGFIDSGLYFDAPMFHWALRNVGACSWTWMQGKQADLTAKEREVVAFNRSMGVVAGYTISFHDNKVRNRAAMSLTAREGMSQADVDRLWSASGHEIHVMCQVTHLIFTTLPYVPPGRSLTNRQREVLEWVGDGKTMQDISAIMGISPATIEKHLRLAREALDVETTAQAVLKASFQNQIYSVNV
jgi:LuxR family transcriptional regulator